MNDFFIYYAPLIVLIAAIGIAFYAALKGSHVDDEED